ncbi:MAG: hypothetical protein MP439_02035 [Ferrimicrobium sp.]|nr:hypothetical protein [Ferrimicrobium sp.]
MADRVEVVLVVDRQVARLRRPAPDKTVEGLVARALPGAVRLDSYTGARHCLAPV